jgi:hypothetical protein
MPRSFRAGTADMQPRAVGPHFVEEQHSEPGLLFIVVALSEVRLGEPGAHCGGLMTASSSG